MVTCSVSPELGCLGMGQQKPMSFREALVLDDFFGSPFSCTPKWDRDRPSTPWYKKMDGGLAMHKIGMICNSFTMGCCTRIPKRTSPSVVSRDLNSDPNPAAPPSQPKAIIMPNGVFKSCWCFHIGLYLKKTLSHIHHTCVYYIPTILHHAL